MNAMTGFPPIGTAVPSARIQLVSIRQHSLAVAKLRVLWIVLTFAFVALLAVMRIGFLGMSDRAVAATSLEDALLPDRGEIVDRNGVPLARAFPAYALWFNPDALGEDGSPLVRPAAEVAQDLKAIFPELDLARVTRALASGKPGYLRRRVLPEEANRVQELGELALEMPQETDRHYPQGSMAAHILGYVAADGHGRVGMEQVLDERLLDPSRRGAPMALSIDVRVQGALEDELRRGMKLVDAKGAAGIVLDVDTGEVMALASLPEFDPNKIDAVGQNACSTA
jgi:cell division protein FtsI (penicillin-binding protein 3)